jgi:hypothetical protein
MWGSNNWEPAVLQRLVVLDNPEAAVHGNRVSRESSCRSYVARNRREGLETLETQGERLLHSATWSGHFQIQEAPDFIGLVK